MNNIFLSELRLLAADLCVGNSLRTVCPACSGGSKGEKSLHLTATDDGTLYICHRASCDMPPGCVGGSRRGLVHTRPRTPQPRPYTAPLLPLTDMWRSLLYDKVGFDAEHIAAARPMLTEDGRVAYPIRGPLWQRRGWVLRSYTGLEPKAMTRMDTLSEPSTAWYPPSSPTGDEREVWLVEDIPSAVRAARYVPAIALLGTGTTPEGMMEIAAYHREVVWALDADAVGTAFRNCRKYSLLFDHSQVQMIEKDLKDMKEDELCELVG